MLCSAYLQNEYNIIDSVSREDNMDAQTNFGEVMILKGKTI